MEAARERGGELDFVEHLAAPFPLQVICDMLGVPPSDEPQIFEWTNLINGIGDPEFEYSLEKLNSTIMEMYEYALALGRDRRQNPRDDIASILMAAEVDGKRLTANEFCELLQPPRRGGQRDDTPCHLLGRQVADGPS